MIFKRSSVKSAVKTLVIVFLLSVWCSNSHAYKVSKTSGGIEIKWNTTSVMYFINPSGGPSGSLSEIQASMQTWTSVSTSSFTFINGGSTSSTAWGEKDGKNIVCFGSMGSTGTLAANYKWYYTSTGKIVDSDIKFNTDYPLKTDGSADAYDVQNNATHEFGHSLSLDDLYSASDSDKTMYGYGSKGETKKRTLNQDDKNGITYLYPSTITTTTTTTTTTTSTTTTPTTSTTTTTLPTVPTEPTLTVTTSGAIVTVSWTSVANAIGYTLFYAPYPYTGADSIGSVEMGTKTGASFNLWRGATFYVAVQAYNGVGNSGYSNIKYFIIDSSISVVPASLILPIGGTGTCAMSGGTSPYSASSSDTSVATASVSGSTLSVTGVSAGSATITVSDSGSDSTTVSVTVFSSYINSLGQTFTLLPAGTFAMGSPTDELGRESNETQHQVTLTQPFYMMTTEVTQAQWEAVMGSNPSYFSGCSTCPVEYVSWNDVQSFITQMNLRREGTYSLPTEAQWEYAARAGSTTAFYNGGITETGWGYDPNLDAIGWYCYNSDETHPVAQKTPNGWGLYDMSGNVREWCQDWRDDDYYSSNPVTDPTGPSSGLFRVQRGGSFGSYAGTCRSAERGSAFPTYHFDSLGFRLVRQP